MLKKQLVLQQLWRNRKKYFVNLFVPGEITAVDIDNGIFKLLQLKEIANRWEISKFLQIPLSDKEKISGLPALLETNQVRIKTIVATIPRHFLIQRYLTVPSIDTSEIHEMVKYQAPGLVPYPKEEIIYDYQIISQDAGGYSKVLVVIAHDKAVDEIVSVLHEGNLEPDIIQLRSAAVANFYLTVEEKEIKDKIVILIDKDAESMDISFLLNNRLAGSRGFKINTFGQDEIFSKILTELKQGLSVLKEELGEHKIEKIVLSGTDSRNKLADFLEEELSLPVEHLSIFPKISLDKTLYDRSEEIQEVRSLTRIIGSCIGLLKDSSISFNLLPWAIKKKRELVLQRRMLLQKVSLAAMVFFLLSANIFLTSYKGEKKVRELHARIRKIEPEAAVISSKKQSLDLIREEASSNLSVLNVVEELYKITPPTVFLSTLDIETGKVAILKGQAQELSQVFDYITILEKSPFFQNIRANYATRRRVGDMQVVSFEFYCRFSENNK